MTHRAISLALALAIAPMAMAAQKPPLENALACVVKLYGAGGIGRLEAYGTGVLVSSDGIVVTVDAPMLDTDNLRAVLADGRRLKAKKIGIDPERELAALKLDASDLPFLEIDPSRTAQAGDPIWALTNLFNIATGREAVSVQHGVISSVATIAARKGVLQLTYPGHIYVLDVITNNPGAAGGAVIDASGNLIAVVGKDVRSIATNTWINFAIPIEDVHKFIEDAKAGRAEMVAKRIVDEDLSRRELTDADLRGIRTLPDLLDRTPAFIDSVEPGSPADLVGLRPDDLILFVGETLIQSVKDLRAAILQTPQDQPIELAVLRDERLLKLSLPPRK